MARMVGASQADSDAGHERGPRNSWLQCIRGCGGRYSIYDVVYRCPQCGGLLDVQHETEA